MQTIEVEVRNVYGQDKIYPVNDAARLLAEVAGTKTLSPYNLGLAQQLGFTIVEITKERLSQVALWI